MSYLPQPGYGAPGGYPQAGGYPPQGGYAGPPPSNGLATGALVTGLISALCFPALFIVAIPLGFMGLSKAKNLNGVGRGQAIGGLVAGFFGLLWVVLLGAMLILGAGFFATQVDDLTCSANRFSLETAASAYQAREGQPPDSEQQLVETGDLDAEIRTYDLEPGTTNAVAVSGEGCD